MLSEKAKSKAQQRFFGMVRAAQKGEMENPSSEVLDAADSMKVDDVKKFAKTKHKGLPEKKEVKEEKKGRHPRDQKELDRAQEYIKKNPNFGKKKKIEEVAFLAGLAKGAAVAAKGAVKQKAKQVVQQKAANVAVGAIPQPNRDQQVESKGTAELAAIKLRGRKACAVCGSLAHATGQCPKKEHGDVNEGIGRTIGKVAGTVAKAAKAVNREVLPIKHAKNLEQEVKKGYEESKPKEVKKKINKKRNILQKGIGKVARAVSSKTDKIASTMGEAKVDKGRSDYGKATIRNWRHSGPSTVEPAMFDPENKRGKTIDKRREEHKARRGKKGAKVPVHGVDEGVVKAIKNFVNPPAHLSNEPSVRAGVRTPQSTHMFKHVPSYNKDGTTGQYGKKGTTAVVQGVGNVAKKFTPNAKTVAKAALPVAGAVGAGLAVSKGVDSLMKMGKKKKIKEQILDELNLDELKLFGKKGSGAIFYNDPKGRRDALQSTGKDPGAINKPAVNKAVNTVKTKVQKTVDTQTNRAGSNIGNQISRKVKPAVSQGVSQGIQQGAAAVGKAALKGAGAVGAGLAVSKGVDSLMKGGKKKTNEELSIVDRMLIEYSPNKEYVILEKGAAIGGTDALFSSGKKVSKTIGTGAGALMGAIAGGPIGAIAGGVLGNKVGGKVAPKNPLKNEEVTTEALGAIAAGGAKVALGGAKLAGKAAVGGAKLAGKAAVKTAKVAGKVGKTVAKQAATTAANTALNTAKVAGSVVKRSGRAAAGAVKGALSNEEFTNEGVVDVIKKGTKRHKDAVEKKKIKNRKAVPYAALGASHELEGEEVVNELKTSTLRSYVNRASIDAVGRGVDAGIKGMTGPKKEMEKNMTKAYKRQRGINTAANKLASRAEKAERNESYRVLASSDGQEKPSQFSYKDEKTAKKYADSIKKGGGKATVVKEDIGSFKDYMANVEASKKRQQDKQENRKKKSDAYIERVRKGIKFYDAKGSGRMVKGKKVYDRK